MNRREVLKVAAVGVLPGQGTSAPTTVKKHFVCFYSPGTIVAETTEQPIESWDTQVAMEMARSIKERHGATPYGFRFLTRERGAEDLDSHESASSPMYYLGGRILTVDEFVAQNDPRNDILISNMRCNGWRRVLQNDNSWRWTRPLCDDDVVLDFVP